MPKLSQRPIPLAGYSSCPIPAEPTQYEFCDGQIPTRIVEAV